MSLIIRPETLGDAVGIGEVVSQAFPTSAEANLVSALRLESYPFVSWVAELEDQIVGHICFSVATLDCAPDMLLMGLAPMAVRPSHQNQDIGGKLVLAGLDACQSLGAQAVIVLGHPHYYPRFGFEPASKYELFSEYDVPDEVFMARESQPGSLAQCRGLVRYHPAFSKL